MTAMIRIRWAEAIEYVPLSTSRPVAPTQTYEMWRDGDYVTYNVKSELSKRDDDLLELRTHYLLADNRSLEELDIPWGRSVITFSKGATNGHALWFDEDAKPGHRPGKSFWKVASEGDLRRLERIEATRIRRDSTLRSQLVDSKCVCAISGEPAYACDAAHLRSVADRGTDVALNAMLLRADLHRLFDGHYFDIDENGKICDVDPSLSDFYKDQLEGKQISPTDLKRTREALANRAKRGSRSQ